MPAQITSFLKLVFGPTKLREYRQMQSLQNSMVIRINAIKVTD